MTVPPGETWWLVDYSEDGQHYERVPLRKLDKDEAEKVAQFLNQYVDDEDN